MTVGMSVEEKLVEGLQEFLENDEVLSNGAKELAERLLEKIKPVPEKRMCLKVDEDGDLGVFYGDNEILYLNRTDGDVCLYYGYEDVRASLEKWMIDGMKFDDSVITWEGKEDVGRYFLMESRGCVFLIRADVIKGSIYNITHRCPMQQCEDPNISKDSQGIPWVE